MSHVTEFTGVVITNITALEAAIKHFCPDVELVRQAHYRTWKDDHNGNFVGDTSPPPGVRVQDLGENAEYVIRVTDAQLQKMRKGAKRSDYGMPYEIGVVRSADGTYRLMMDYWNQGQGILKLPGLGEHDEEKNTAFDQLFMHYRMMEVQQAAAAAGDQLEFFKEGDRWYAVADTTQRLTQY